MKYLVLTISTLIFFASPAFCAGQRAAKILTPEVAEKILGQPVKGAAANSAVDAESGKNWTSRVHYDAASGADLGCGLMLQHFETTEQANAAFTAYGKKFQAVPVKGLGFDAYKIDGATPVLGALKGKNYFVVGAGPAKTGNLAMQERLTKELVSKVQDE